VGRKVRQGAPLAGLFVIYISPPPSKSRLLHSASPLSSGLAGQSVFATGVVGHLDGLIMEVLLF